MMRKNEVISDLAFLGQASICTEWEQSSMVLNPCSQVGATVTTSEKAKAAGMAATSTSAVSPPVKQQSPPKSPAATMAGISSILQVRLQYV